jgi:glycosyltransferase involved in cell wall biosynthesis
VAKIAYLLLDNQASEWYRAFVPGQMLTSKGHSVCYLNKKDPIENFLASDVVIFIRAATPFELHILNILQESGRRIIIDLDDNPWALPKSIPRISYWEATGSRLILEKCLEWADLITVTTQEMLIALKRFNPNIEILENCLPDFKWINIQKQDVKEPLVIGWGGGVTHSEDLRLIASPLLQIIEKYPHVELHLAGNFEIENSVDNFFRLVNPFPKNNRIKIIALVPIENYQELLSGFDIGIAPLNDTPFNRCKSDLKFLEYSALEIPCVASAVTPYLTSIVQGETGFLAKNDEDWTHYLIKLIESTELRKKIGKAAKAWAAKRMISANIKRWERAYKIYP